MLVWYVVVCVVYMCVLVCVCKHVCVWCVSVCVWQRPSSSSSSCRIQSVTDDSYVQDDSESFSRALGFILILSSTKVKFILDQVLPSIS